MIGQPTEGALIALAMKVRLRFKIFQKFKKKERAGIVRSDRSDQTSLQSPDWF